MSKKFFGLIVANSSIDHVPLMKVKCKKSLDQLRITFCNVALELMQYVYDVKSRRMFGACTVERKDSVGSV